VNILRLHTKLHHSGARAIVDGKLSAISEARLTRVKQTGTFPHRSIRYMMDTHGHEGDQEV
jgi:predicted NodU family carbamoyl transferase